MLAVTCACCAAATWHAVMTCRVLWAWLLAACAVVQCSASARYGNALWDYAEDGASVHGHPVRNHVLLFADTVCRGVASAWDIEMWSGMRVDQDVELMFNDKLFFIFNL